VWEKVTATTGRRQTPKYKTKSKICVVGHFRHLVTEKVKNVSNNILMFVYKASVGTTNKLNKTQTIA